MVALKKIVKNYTIKEYLKLERQSNRKHEFYNGKIKEEPGGTTNHNLIASNAITELNIALRNKDKEYFVLNSDMKIQIPEFNHFVYPDAVVICEKIKLYKGRNDVIINPLLVVEVLSPSTKKNDRGQNFLEYKTLHSFQEYLLLSQKQPWANVNYREEVNLWSDETVRSLEEVVYLKSIDVKIMLKDFYKGVRFEK